VIPRPAPRAALAAVCIACLSVISCGNAAKPAPRAPAQVVVQIVQPQHVVLRTELPGRTAAYAESEVRPQVGGLIRERLFTEGAAVRAGQTLYQIEPASFQAALEQEQGAQASAQAALRIAQLLVDRYRQLLPAKTISQQDFDNADAALAQARANLSLRNAAVNAARINLQWTRITAPISGRTGRSTVTVGALVSANQAAALTTISQLDPIYVDLSQSSNELLRLRRSAQTGGIQRDAADTQKVSLLMEDGTAYPLEGRMKLREVTVDPTTGAVALRAEFANPDGLLLPGMYVRALVTEGTADNGILIPQQALQRGRKGDARVKLVDAQGKIQLRAVVATRTIGANWLVDSGLSAGDRLVIEGAQNAQPGSAVKIVSADR
jgi:membrane fusion protein (multidrug efflux system)